MYVHMRGCVVTRMLVDVKYCGRKNSAWPQ